VESLTGIRIGEMDGANAAVPKQGDQLLDNEFAAVNRDVLEDKEGVNEIEATRFKGIELINMLQAHRISWELATVFPGQGEHARRDVDTNDGLSSASEGYDQSTYSTAIVKHAGRLKARANGGANDAVHMVDVKFAASEEFL